MTDVTAADWAAMRATIEHEERATTHWDGCWTTHRNCRTLLALDALARQQEANARLTAEVARLVSGLDAAMCATCDQTIVRGHAPDCPHYSDMRCRAEHAEAALADRDATIARLTAALTAAQFDRDEAVKDFLFGVHHDCRPNRKQAESWRDQLRDETDRHADTKAALADRDATIARLRSFLTLEKGRYQAELDAGVVSGTFLHRIRGKRDMCGEALAQLPLTPAKEADRG
jgi:hypothetical protein